MKHTFVLPVTLLLFSASVVSSGEGNEDAKMMEGSWVPAFAELANKKLPDAALKAMKLVLKGNQYTVTIGKVIDQGTIELAPSKKPKGMDIKGTEGPNKGKTILAIYELTKDSLKVCYDLSGTVRPMEFETKAGTQQFLVTYKRQKP